MRMRGNRISSVDLAWTGHWSALVASPLEVAAPERIRAGLARFLEEHPRHPLACRLDLRRGRWVPVPPAERDRHLDELVWVADPMLDEDFPAEIERHRPSLDTDIPFRVAVGDRHAVVYLMHVVGDAAMFTEIALRLVRGQGEALAELTTRVRLADPARAVFGQSRSTYRAWLGRALPSRSAGPVDRSSSGPAAPPHVTASPVSASPVSASPGAAGAVGVVLDNSQLRAITRWRNDHAPGASITAVLAARTSAGLIAEGVDLRTDGFYSLFDIRPYLDDTTTWWGNPAKSLLLDADLTDPHSIDRAIREVQETRRALPALVAGAALTGLRRTVAVALRRPVVDRHAPDAAGPAPVTMTFNSMPTLPGLAGLPWLAEGRRRYVGVGYPVPPDGLTVFAVRFRDRMEITASFDRSALDADRVARALDAVAIPEEPSPARRPAGSVQDSGT